MLSLITRMSAWLPSPLRRHATPERLELLSQMIAFGCTGLFGFVLDTATVYGLRRMLGLYGAGIVAYFVAATGTWAVNRVWTFRGHGGGPAHRQWARFLVFNMFGFVLNRGAYALLVTYVSAFAEEPVFAVAAGAIAGMGVNFILSRRLVFRVDSSGSRQV